MLPVALSMMLATLLRAKAVVYQNANIILVQRNWLLGRRIALENMGGKHRAGNGQQTIKQLADELTKI